MQCWQVSLPFRFCYVLTSGYISPFYEWCANPCSGVPCSVAVIFFKIKFALWGPKCLTCTSKPTKQWSTRAYHLWLQRRLDMIQPFSWTSKRFSKEPQGSIFGSGWGGTWCRCHSQWFYCLLRGTSQLLHSRVFRCRCPSGWLWRWIYLTRPCLLWFPTWSAAYRSGAFDPWSPRRGSRLLV